MSTKETYKLNVNEFKMFVRLNDQFDASTQEGAWNIAKACEAIGMKPEMVIEYALLLGHMVRHKTQGARA